MRSCTSHKRLIKQRLLPIVALGAATLGLGVACSSDDDPGESKGGTSGTSGGSSGKGGGASGGSAGVGATGGGAGTGTGGGAGTNGSGGASVGGSAGAATGGTSGAGGTAGGTAGAGGKAGAAGTGGSAPDGGSSCTPYPAGPYGNQVGQTFPNLTWEGYVNDTADAVSNTKPFGNYSSTQLCTSGRSYALVHLSEYF